MKKVITVLGMVMVITVSVIGVVTMMNNNEKDTDIDTTTIKYISYYDADEAVMKYIKSENVFDDSDKVTTVEIEAQHLATGDCFWDIVARDADGKAVGMMSIDSDLIVERLQNYI